MTVDITLLNLCRGRFEHLSSRGFDITVVCGPTDHADELRACGVRLLTLPLTRSITPWSDLCAIVSLWRFLRAERFDVVEVSTPKGALVGSIAARVPRVVLLRRGLAYERLRGLKRWIVKWAHAIPCRLAHEVISISPSLMDLTVREGFGGVLLEAAASGLPTIATDIVGCRDPVVDGTTGLFIPSQDSESLAAAMERLTSDEKLRERMGRAGRLNAERCFAQEKVWARQEAALRLMAAQGARSPERRAALSVLISRSVEVDSGLVIDANAARRSADGKDVDMLSADSTFVSHKETGLPG